MGRYALPYILPRLDLALKNATQEFRNLLHAKLIILVVISGFKKMGEILSGEKRTWFCILSLFSLMTVDLQVEAPRYNIEHCSLQSKCFCDSF